jgi:hypothetical protein
VPLSREGADPSRRGAGGRRVARPTIRPLTRNPDLRLAFVRGPEGTMIELVQRWEQVGWRGAKKLLNRVARTTNGGNQPGAPNIGRVTAPESYDYAYVLETGRVVLERLHRVLVADDRARRAYLGM